MKSYGPKPLIELDGRETVIARQVRLVRAAYPTAEFIAVVGHEADRVVRSLPAGVKAVENERYDESNVARSICMGLRVATHPRVLVVYGDMVFNAAAVEDVARHGSALLVDRTGQMEDDEVGVTVVDGRVTCFSYGLPAKWCHVAFLAGRELELMRRVVSDPARRNHYGFEALNAVLEAGGRLRAVEPAGMRVAEIDVSRQIERARGVAALDRRAR
jgi:choline kinase